MPITDLSGIIPASQIDSAMASDTEVAAAIAAHEASSSHDTRYVPLRPIGIEFAEQPGGVNYLDFHTHETIKDFDVRLRISGGGMSSGMGFLLFQAGLIQFNSNISVGGGAQIVRLLSVVTTIDMPSIATGAIGQTTQSIAGAITGDLALFTPLAMPTNLPFFNIQAIVSAAGVATIYFHNLSANAIDLPAFSGRLLVLGFS
ncbi:hypothetical protein [Microcoleus sp. Pol10D4]|uniref:hypothetical protein n=1 Tax=Microcoleus sp. Pol10D4 TaxID=3055387 RepID=UPI002FCFB73D